MKIALLSAANSIHTVKWANGLASRGVDLHLISAHPLTDRLHPCVTLHLLPFQAPWGYLASVFALRKLLAHIKPDLLNAHYATGYGLLARLCGFKPLLLSVWGSDVYDFPAKSVLHRAFLKGNLKSATAVASTSRCMGRKTAETFAHEQIFITPFGVDEQVFAPKRLERGVPSVVIGTVKTLKDKYGIDTLIEAFALVCAQVGNTIRLTLEITGGGPDLPKLQSLAQRLGVDEQVIFHGQLPHARVPEMLNRLDVYVALSRLDSESFGVAILEASACEKPVVVSDADGPAEVTLDGETGFIVPKNNAKAAAQAILKLVRDPALRWCMGEAGRAHVLEHYTWEKSINIMLEAYHSTIAISRFNISQ